MKTNDPLAYEQLGLGDKWTSEERVIIASDLISFADLTGDHDPLHTDSEFAATGPFGRPVAHGLLGLSILAGLSSNAPSVLTAALVDIRSWNFSKPVFVGDSLHAITEIIDLQARGRRHGEVHWYRQLFNQHGERVQDGILVTLVIRRVPLPTKKTRISALETAESSLESANGEAVGTF